MPAGIISISGLPNIWSRRPVERGEITAKEMPVYSELTRRLGFEYNGMVLHEWYFGNLKNGGSGDPDKGSAFYKAAEATL